MNSSIWKNTPNLQAINELNKNTLGETLGIEFTDFGDNFLTATMPVDERTKQPFGLLHGGANVALAETLGSVASLLAVNQELFIGVGVEINANHLRAVLIGKVTGVCMPLHLAGKNHVWEIKIYNDEQELTCISRFTCTIIPKNKWVK
jgi:1,4-dihydroxy-2-naphthoyl-CoA hydrolase